MRKAAVAGLASGRPAIVAADVDVDMASKKPGNESGRKCQIE